MNFEQLLDSALELLRRRRRLTYVALRRQFDLDDPTLADLAHELIRGQQVARDEDGAVLVWCGPETPPLAGSRSDAERRQITILFCDLVDSTALSNALDPEELRVVLRAFQGTAKAIIERYEAFVNSYMGDGIVVFFGYPQAHEDDSVSAVRAGLEIVAAVEALGPRADIRLRVRVGIATGVVVVGDVIGEGASREESVVGSTSNLAARLQSLAGPGEVLIAGATKRLIARRFACVDLGPQRLKGFDVPVPAWRVVAERAVEDDTPSGIELSPLVDRVIEFPALRESWREARAGNGRVVTLLGEPGLGKSRLCEALREAVADEPHFVLRYYCSTRFQNTALYPVIRQLHRTAQLSDDDTADVKLRKLELLLQRGRPASELAPTLPYIAALLSIPVDDRYTAIADSPERQREQTLLALAEQVLGLAQSQPVLLIFEDLHWVDPSTLSLLDQLVRKIGQVPVMVLCTGRPEFAPPWSELPQARLIELSLLEREDRSSIVEHQAGGKSLPPEILEHILQKSDGNPLYVEELTKATMESGLMLEQGGRYVLTGPMRTLAVPSTLHDSLLARLDRLSVAKEVVQAGAAIGREFAYNVLASLLPLAPDELQATLGRLTEAGLLHRRGTPPDTVYSFKHALIQDAAYATMLRPKRQALHARIAQILESDAGAAAREPELLAHHLIEAGLPAKAIPCLQQAGLLASAAAAHAEACRHFGEGLRLLSELPDDVTRNRLELGLRVHLGMSLAATHGFAAAEVEATNQRARELCRLIGDTDELFWVLRGLCALYIVRADAPTSRELSAHLVRLGEETQRAEFLIEGHLMQGYTQAYAGELEAGRAALLKVVDIYRSKDGASMVFPTPQDPAVAALSLLAVVCWILGEAEAAGEYAGDAVRSAEASKRPFDVAYAHSFVAMFENLRRDPQRAAHHAGVAIEIAQRHGFGVWLAAAAMHLGIAKAALGAAEEAIGLLGATLPAWQGSGAELNSGFFLAGLAAGHRAAGHLDLAIETVTQAIEHAARHNERYYDAELFRLRGEMMAARDVDAARADFQCALDTAQRQGARLFELRTAVSFARLLSAAGERARARSLLASAVAKMPGAAETRDGRDATTLLAELTA
jgi:class 3 adenylate cyclase/tetratricopeptide (TPR) repeat protein